MANDTYTLADGTKARAVKSPDGKLAITNKMPINAINTVKLENGGVGYLLESGAVIRAYPAQRFRNAPAKKASKKKSQTQTDRELYLQTFNSIVSKFGYRQAAQYAQQQGYYVRPTNEYSTVAGGVGRAGGGIAGGELAAGAFGEEWRPIGQAVGTYAGQQGATYVSNLGTTTTAQQAGQAGQAGQTGTQTTGGWGSSAVQYGVPAAIQGYATYKHSEQNAPKRNIVRGAVEGFFGMEGGSSESKLAGAALTMVGLFASGGSSIGSMAIGGAGGAIRSQIGTTSNVHKLYKRGLKEFLTESVATPESSPTSTNDKTFEFTSWTTDGQTNELEDYAIGLLNPYGLVISEGDLKRGADAVAVLAYTAANGAKDKEEVRRNVIEIANRLNIDDQQIAMAMVKSRTDFAGGPKGTSKWKYGYMTDERASAYLNSAVDTGRPGTVMLWDSVKENTPSLEESEIMYEEKEKQRLSTEAIREDFGMTPAQYKEYKQTALEEGWDPGQTSYERENSPRTEEQLIATGVLD